MSKENENELASIHVIDDQEDEQTSASDEKMELSVVSPEKGADRFQKELKAQARRSKSSVMYNKLAKDYNKATVGSFITVKNLSNANSLSNMEKILHNRGLVRDEDYVMFKPTEDEKGNKVLPKNRPIVIHKRTEKNLRTI